MDATINFDIVWMRANRKSAISVKRRPLPEIQGMRTLQV